MATTETKPAEKNNKKEKKQEKEQGEGGGGLKEVITKEAQGHEVTLLSLQLVTFQSNSKKIFPLNSPAFHKTI